MGVSSDASFQDFAARKGQRATSARIERLATIVESRDASPTLGIGNAWTRLHYGGDFGLLPIGKSVPAISLVFVQTRTGNTGARNPGALGGGATDEHLIYEGLSRVAADAVLAGAGTVHKNAFFSVWHPELVALRSSLGLPRHPAQIVVSRRGNVNPNALLFNVPDVPVFLIAGEEGFARLEGTFAARPWIRHIRLESNDLRSALAELRGEAQVRRISAVGGRLTATELVDEGLVQDIYLTTTASDGGEPNTPWYMGPAPPPLAVITEKQWQDHGMTVVFDHYLIG